jgi:hypothetical protein
MTGPDIYQALLAFSSDEIRNIPVSDIFGESASSRLLMSFESEQGWGFSLWS